MQEGHTATGTGPHHLTHPTSSGPGTGVLSPAPSPARQRELIAAARDYVGRGYAVLPIPAGQKSPDLPHWQRLRLRPYQLHAAFVGSGNIGLLLGRMSRDLVDVDLDCEEARRLADQFLPPTPAETGRATSPRSHRWYISRGVQTTRHRDPITKASIVELRGTGSQTLVGPSIHPTGERYDNLIGEPTFVSADELIEAVKQLASEVIRLRHGELPTTALTARDPVISTPQGLSRHTIHRRASAYLATLPPAISGCGGHNATFAAATALVHGFCLSEREALELLRDEYNPRCEPAWSDRELEHKIQQAVNVPHRRPQGWLL